MAEFESYKGANVVIAESVYQFLRGTCWGAVWGLVTPIYPPGTVEAKREAATGIFKPAPPFRSLASVPSNALVFGCLVGIQRFGCKSMELMRFKEDFWNDLFGCACIYPYYKTFIGNTERRLVLHNRAVGGALAMAIVYANLIV